MDLQDKVVIVTGASRGIGRQIALEVGRRANVVLAARTVKPRRTLPGTLGETVGLIERDGGTAIAVHCDVANAADLERLVATTVDTFGRLDVVVNNAADMAGQDLESLVASMIGSPDVGAGGAERAADGPLDNWLRQFATNVHGPFLLMGMAIPHLRAQGGGVIVNMSSSVAEMVPVARSTSASERPGVINPGSLGYATTKAALNRLTNAAAADLAADNIAVVAVDPGVTRTEVVDLLGERGLLNADEWAPTSIPVGTVLDVLTADDPMAFSGQVIEAQPQ
jgi:NAD(P)-dependent dehydrogenase (short-subunit alcohol dehydrogenase family)